MPWQNSGVARRQTKERSRAYHLKRVYGLTPEQYQELLDKQNGACAVCQRPEESFNVKLAVDHDHVTGEIRGLLCSHCNHRLVGRHRNSAILRRIADYIDSGTGWFVPKPQKRRRRVKTKTQL